MQGPGTVHPQKQVAGPVEAEPVDEKGENHLTV
jgi:hypothetical protein